MNKNPWKGRDCYREDCFLCDTKRTLIAGKKYTCWKQSALYQTWCQTCADREKAKAIEEGRNPENIREHIYVGETSRSAYTRGKEHKNDARLMNPESHVSKHYLKFHTIQQIQKNHHLMNSKSQYRACKIPRITIKMGDTEMYEETERRRREQKEDNELEQRIKTMNRMSQKRRMEE